MMLKHTRNNMLQSIYKAAHAAFAWKIVKRLPLCKSPVTCLYIVTVACWTLNSLAAENSPNYE